LRVAGVPLREMILLIGHGYMGMAFAKELTSRGRPFHHATHANALEHMIVTRYYAVINAAAFVPTPSVSLCDKYKEETIEGNLLFPIILAHACRRGGSILMHLSTACLYDEAHEYPENHKPMRGWDDYCGMYVGTKLMAEWKVSSLPCHYIVRVRLPFDEIDNHRNYLSKIARYPNVYDHVNSLCHRGDCVKAALDLIDVGAPYGTYHVANDGSISAREIVMQMVMAGIIKKFPEFVPGPCKGTRLNIDKLLSTGVRIRRVEDAVEYAIKNWRTE
jgi:dTDP-4-dehydrorhamnose reductase